MKANFEAGFKAVIGVEGGLVNDPNDKGGLTKYGISKKAFPNLDIANLTLDDAKRIYKQNYWDKCRCDDLPASFDIAVFDTAVNMGIKEASILLQKTLGVTADGIIGNKTLAAAKTAGETELRRFFLLRLYDYSQFESYKHYKKGWLNRLLDISEVV